MMLNISSKSRPLQQQIMSIQPPTQQISRLVHRVLNEIARDSPESGDRSLISGWGYAELANESAGHVALVCKASLCSGLGGCSAGSIAVCAVWSSLTSRWALSGYADAGQMHLYLNYAREHWMK